MTCFGVCFKQLTVKFYCCVQFHLCLFYWILFKAHTWIRNAIPSRFVVSAFCLYCCSGSFTQRASWSSFQTSGCEKRQVCKLAHEQEVFIFLQTMRSRSLLVTFPASIQQLSICSGVTQTTGTPLYTDDNIRLHLNSAHT